MKAITLFSLSALALAGAACSESAPETEPTTQQETATDPASGEDSGFNLDLFESDSGDDGFNIGFEDGTNDPLSSFEFGDDRSDRLLQDVPIVESPTLMDDDEPARLPQAPVEDDDIIRLPE